MGNPVSDFGPFHLATCGACPSCRYVLPPLGLVSAKYFANGSVSCERWGAHVDAWQAARGGSQRRGVSAFGLQALGATRTTLIFPLAPGATKALRRSRHG